MNENIGILFDGDALVAKQGRAEDVLLAGTYKFSDHFLVHCGYRILEGGADGGEVYNFALFHYASVGIVYTFILSSVSNLHLSCLFKEKQNGLNIKRC